MRRSTLAAVALIPACALALSACGSQKAGASAGASVAVVAQSGGPNNAHLTQAQLVARLKAALASATAVHIQGTMKDGGSGTAVSTKMDMQINKDGTGRGTIDMGGAVGVSDMSMPMISIGSTVYMQATASYVKLMKQGMSLMSGDAAMSAFYAQLTPGKWLKYTGGSSGSMFGQMMSFSDMADQLGGGSSDTFTYVGTGTVDGQQVAQYKDHSKDGSTPDAVMSVALNGSPLPIQEDAGSSGRMTFTWNQPTTITAPPADEVVTVPAELAGAGSSEVSGSGFGMSSGSPTGAAIPVPTGT